MEVEELKRIVDDFQKDGIWLVLVLVVSEPDLPSRHAYEPELIIQACSLMRSSSSALYDAPAPRNKIPNYNHQLVIDTKSFHVSLYKTPP